MYGYVYVTTDLSNGMIYVGLHKSETFDDKYLGSGLIIRKKILKYGKENFTCRILEECLSEEELNEKEIFWIKELDSTNKSIGYNIATGGAFGDSGYHLGMLGKHLSENQKLKMRDFWKTFKFSDLSKQKMSISKLGNTNAAGNIGYIHIFKDDCEIKVKQDDLESYLSDGWKKGHKPYSDEIISKNKERHKNSIYIIKDDVVKYILKDDLQSYLDNGWKIGRGTYSEDRKLKSSLTQKGRICITDGLNNKYIDKNDWPEYESLGYFKMSKQKYKKIYEKTQ